jgi:hypothetical protein
MKKQKEGKKNCVLKRYYSTIKHVLDGSIFDGQALTTESFFFLVCNTLTYVHAIGCFRDDIRSEIVVNL